MERKNNNLLLLVVILLGILVILLGGFIIYDKLLNKEKANNMPQKDSTTIDYSNEIISHYWCEDKDKTPTTCLEFDEDRIRYGEPNTDAQIDSVKFDKIVKKSDYVYEIYGIDGYSYKENENDTGDKYNIVWTVRYNSNGNSITLVEGKRTYLTDTKKVEIEKAYNNIDLYKRNSSDFNY